MSESALGNGSSGLDMTRVMKLRKYNGVLSMLHFVSFAAILGYFLSNEEEIISTRAVSFVTPRLYQDRIQVSVNGTGATFILEDVGTVNVVYLISSFFFLTATFHAIYAANIGGYYDKYLAENRNPLRWFEYSITATIMIVIVSLSATIQNLNLLAFIAVSTVVIMILGLVVENGIAKKQDPFPLIVVTVLAWILQVAIFVYVLVYFTATISAVSDAIEGRDLPGFVYAIIVVEVILFSTFGLVQLSHLYKYIRTKEVPEFLSYENTYHTLSLVAKLLLGWLFFFGALFSGGDEDN